MKAINSLGSESMETITDKRIKEVYQLLKKYGKTPTEWLEERYGKGIVDKLRSLGLASVMIENGIIYAIPDINERIAFPLLYKIWFYHVYAYMLRKELTKEEEAILPILKAYDFVNYDADAVWLTLDGYAYISDLEKLYPDLTKELERQVDEKYAKRKRQSKEQF